MKVLSKSFLYALLFSLIAAWSGALLASEPVDPFAGTAIGANGYYLRNGSCWLVIDGQETIELGSVARTDVLEITWSQIGGRPSITGTYIGTTKYGDWIVIRTPFKDKGANFQKVPPENLHLSDQKYIQGATLKDVSGNIAFPFSGSVTFAPLPTGKGIIQYAGAIVSGAPNPFDQFDPVQSPTKKTVLVDPLENKSSPVAAKMPWEEDYSQPPAAPTQDPATLPAGFVLDKLPPAVPSPALTAEQVKNQQFRDKVNVLRRKAYALDISDKFNRWPKGDNGEQYLDELQMLIDNELGKKTASTSDHFVAWGIGGLILVGLFIGGLMFRILKAINAKSASVIPSALPIAKTDDAIKFNCPNCSRHLECPEDMLGTQINCPACNKLIVAPAPSKQAASPVYEVPAPLTQQQKFTWWWGFAWRTGLFSMLIFIAIVVPCLLLYDAKVFAAPNISNEEGFAIIQVGAGILMYGMAFFVMKRMLAMRYKNFHVILQSNVIVTNGIQALLKVTWNHAAIVWWSFVWRHFLIIACIEWVISLWELSPSTEKTVWNGIAFGIQYFVVYYILGKKFKDFRILAVPVKTP